MKPNRPRFYTPSPPDRVPPRAAPPPRALRVFYRTAMVLVAALLVFIFARVAFSAWLGGKAGGEVDVTARLLGLTDELRGVWRIIGTLLVLDLAAPLVVAALLSFLGRRVRWSARLIAKTAALVAFFAIKPLVAHLTGLDLRDGLPRQVVEIDPERSTMFDGRDGRALAGVVEEPDGAVRFYNLRSGFRQSDGRPIRPCKPEDVARWKRSRGTFLPPSS